MANLIPPPQLPPVTSQNPEVQGALQQVSTYVNQYLLKISQAIDQYLSANGAASALPSAGIFTGQTYYETDTQTWKQWNGSEWVSVGGDATSGIIFSGTTYSTVAEGANITLSGAGETLTIAGASGSSGGVLSFNDRTGTVTLESSDVTTALGFTPGESVDFSGTAITSLVAGENITGTLSGAALTLASSGGGVYNFVSSQVGISAASSVNFTGLAAGYDYEVFGNNIIASASAFLAARLGTGSGTISWLSSNNFWQVVSPSGTTSNNSGDSKLHLTGSSYTWPSPGSSLIFRMTCPANMEGNFGMDGSFSNEVSAFAAQIESTAAVTALQFFFSSGNISGDFYLYSRQK